MPLTKDYSFESARLRYRGIERRDAEDIVRWRSDPANYRNFFNARPITMEDHLAWFDGYLKDTKRYDFLIETPDGKPVGTCGLSAIDESGCEISYMIGDVGSRGKGYATEALRALTEVAFTELEVDHVDARVLAHNKASAKVALGGGYSEHERVFRITRPGSAVDEQQER